MNHELNKLATNVVDDLIHNQPNGIWIGATDLVNYVLNHIDELPYNKEQKEFLHEVKNNTDNSKIYTNHSEITLAIVNGVLEAKFLIDKEPEVLQALAILNGGSND